MPEKKAKRLSDVAPQYAAEGGNDGKWFLLEHQLYQVKVSLTQARQLCESIGDKPENEQDREAAREILEMLLPPFIAFLLAHNDIGAYLAGTEMAERVGREEP